MSFEITASPRESGNMHPGMTAIRSGLHLPPHSRLGARAIRPVVFLDRDGVLVRDVHYLRTASDVELFPGVESLRRLQDRFCLIVATNQSGVARGFFSEDTLLEIHASIAERLESCGVSVDAFYYCPHLDTATVAAYRRVCSCRKPKPGMLLQAAKDWGVPLGSSHLIGDSPRDVQAGSAAGLAGCFLLGDAPIDSLPCCRAGSLPEAVDLILEAH